MSMKVNSLSEWVEDVVLLMAEVVSFLEGEGVTGVKDNLSVETGYFTRLWASDLRDGVSFGGLMLTVNFSH